MTWEISSEQIPLNVQIVEVGPRDGLQDLPDFVDTNDKLDIIKSLETTGISRIEVTSFVNPKVVPQMKDAEKVVESLPVSQNRSQEIQYEATIPNMEGLKRCLGSKVNSVNMFVSASNTHNKKNVNMKINESLKEIERMAKLAKEKGLHTTLTIATAFGCPFEGWVPFKNVERIAEKASELDMDELALGDTTGMANPRLVTKRISRLQDKLDIDLRAHFHDNRGTGLVNAFFAFLAGAHILDSSVGGLGGCPANPHTEVVGGNIATEDMVYAYQQSGIKTGEIDLSSVIKASQILDRKIDFDLPAKVSACV